MYVPTFPKMPWIINDPTVQPESADSFSFNANVDDFIKRTLDEQIAEDMKDYHDLESEMQYSRLMNDASWLPTAPVAPPAESVTLNVGLPSSISAMQHDPMICDVMFGSKMDEYLPEPWMDVDMMFKKMLDDEDILNQIWVEPDGSKFGTRKNLFAYLDSDHCYSAPPKDDMDSPPCSPASSYSEVDVETIPSKTLQIVVPKLISCNPLQGLSSTGLKSKSRRGRKPASGKMRTIKAKRNAISKQKSRKNCQVTINAKVLKAAIKKQSYVTKSGRISKTMNSLETTPSSSSPSSLHSSRCSSDSEEAVDKRISHNLAEKERRAHIRGLFERLCKVVPKEMRKGRDSKAHILSGAVHCVDVMEEQGISLERCKLHQETKLKGSLQYLKDLISS